MAAGKKENQNADHMIRPVAYIHTDFPTKFGIPRQSGLTGDLEAKIVFEPEFSNPEAIRGIEEFSHLWLIWEFSEAKKTPFTPSMFSTYSLSAFELSLITKRRRVAQ